MTMTQSERVLDYMKQFGSITTKEAFADLSITRLSARIWDLKRDGVQIIKHREYAKRRDGSATHWDVYSLKKEE